MMMLLNKKIEVTENYRNIMHVCGWGIPVIFTILPLSLKIFGRNRLLFCWIKNNQNYVQFVSFYTPFILLFCFSFTVILFSMVYLIYLYFMDKNIFSKYSNYKGPFIRNIIFIFFVFIGMVLILSEGIFISIEKENFYFSLLTLLPINGHGIFIFLILGTTYSNFNNWITYLLRLCFVYDTNNIQDNTQDYESVSMFDTDYSESNILTTENY
jgi:hypothetical protein